MIYADSSFIVSVYGSDIHSAAARKYVEQNHPTLPFAFIHWPEITRSLWNHFEAPEKIWAEIEDDLHGGLKMKRVQLNGDRVAERAAGLLKGWLGCWPKLRSLDAMHVAAAVELGAKTFLSFDSRSCQRVLAQTQRLKAWPALTSEELALLR
jgi:predicted nucleic acid-binding protein